MTIFRPANNSEFLSAVESSTFGDVIRLRSGVFYGTQPNYAFGEIHLPNKGTPPTNTDSDYITITTDDPDGIPPALMEYPVKRTRITPEMASRMPTVVAEGSTPLFRLAAGAKYWKLDGLNIRNNQNNPWQMIAFIQTDEIHSLAEVPAHIRIERCWVHPDEEVGQPLSEANVHRSAENAFYLMARDLTIRNCAIQGFVGRNRYGNERGHRMTSAGLLIGSYAEDVLFENNLTEAWTYPLFVGGSGMPDWAVTHGGRVVSASSDTLIRLDNVDGLAVGDPISLRVNGIWGSTFVRRISGNEVQLETPARHSFDGGNSATPIDGDPVAGDKVRWKGIQPNNILSRRNLYAGYKEWSGLMDGDPRGKGYMELKAGTNIRFIGDTFFEGTGPTVTTRNQDGDFCWAKVDVLYESCLWEESDRIFTSFLRDVTPTGKSRARWHNNLILGLKSNVVYPGALKGGELSGAMTGGNGVEIIHNTVAWSKDHTAGMIRACAHGFFTFYTGGSGVMENFVCRDNVMPIGMNACFDGETTIAIQNAFVNPDIGNNVLVNADNYTAGEIAEWYPWQGNLVVNSYSGLFTRPGPTLGRNGDYRAAVGGPLLGTASDGGDIGYNHAKLIAALGRDPLTGVPTEPLPPVPPAPQPTPQPPAPPTPPVPTPVPPTPPSSSSFVWERLSGSPESVMTLAFVGPVLYVGTMLNGVFAYDGSSWTQVNNGLPALPVWIGNFHVTRQGSLLASMRFRERPEASFTYRLSNGTWTESTNGRNEYASFYVSDRDGNILASTNTSTVLRSVDDGRTFQHFSDVPPVNSVGSTTFSLGSGVDETIYLHSHDTGQFYSTDAGFTWNHMGIGSGPSGNQTALTSNAQGQMIAASGFGGIYRNQGSLTSPAIQLEKNLQVSNDAGAHSLIRLVDGTLVSHFIRISVSKDGGKTWTMENTGIPSGTTSGAQNVRSLHTGDLAQGPDGRVYVGFLDAGFGVYRTVGGKPRPVPPAPVPVPPVPPTPPTSSNMIRVQGRTLNDDVTIPAVEVELNGMKTVSRAEDGFFWFDTLVQVGSIITGSKEGWVFTPTVTKEGTPEHFYGLQGRPVAQPPQPPAPQPPIPPEPQPPVPTPVPQPPPAPTTPCSISAQPASIDIRRNSTGVIAVVLKDVSESVEVKVIGSDGQVTVTPLIWTANATSGSKQFQVRVKNKKQTRTITFQSPCGSVSVKVNVT